MEVNDHGFCTIYCSNTSCLNHQKGIEKKVSKARPIYNNPFIREGDDVLALCDKCMNDTLKEIQSKVVIYRKQYYTPYVQLELELFKIPIEFKSNKNVTITHIK